MNDQDKQESPQGDFDKIDVEELDDKSLDTVSGGFEENSNTISPGTKDPAGPNGVQCYC